MANPASDKKRLRLLVTIASYGRKNAELLQRVIAQYQDMELDADIVVLSNEPRDLGPNVKVIVGLPTPDPWSLPFAHKAVFAEMVDHYDLFAYTEDDMGVSEQNIRAFVEASPQLAADEIAGFLRYELGPTGARSLPEVHGGYRWKPATAARRGRYTVAEFTNEHAAFYLLSRDQLRQMVAHDGFVRVPSKGRYDLACTAATDPYTRYGLRKIICISALDDFLIHHLSDRYAGQMGIPLDLVRLQIQALEQIAEGSREASTLVQAETRWPDGQWAKDGYERPNPDVLNMIPSGTRTLLSLGCGWGASEESLVERGFTVTALPLDAILGVLAERPGIEVLHGSLPECISKLEGRVFDCVLITDLLHLTPNPRQVVDQCSALVGDGRHLVICGPNFNSLRILAKRALGKGDYCKLRSFDEGGIHRIGPGSLKRDLARAGFEITSVRWLHHPAAGGVDRRLGRWGSTLWVLNATKSTG